MDENIFFRKLGTIQAALQTLNEKSKIHRIGTTIYGKTKVLRFCTILLLS